MNDALFMLGPETDALVSFVSQWVVFGLGFGAASWALGHVVYWVVDMLRGGLV